MAQVIFTIDDSNLAEYKEGFLAENPVPIAEEGETQLTENQWIKEWGRQQYVRAYKRGKMRLAQQATLLEDNLIT